MTTQRQEFEAFAAKFCGVPYADLVRGETTGLAFGWACWQEAQSVLESENAHLKDALERIANHTMQTGCEHWRDLARETLTEPKPNQEK